MSFEALWLSLVEKKPMLSDPECKVTIEQAEFKKLLRQFHEQGVKTGKKEPSVFEQMFGWSLFGKGHT